jgi:hypothetical protein
MRVHGAFEDKESGTHLLRLFLLIPRHQRLRKPQTGVVVDTHVGVSSIEAAQELVEPVVLSSFRSEEVDPARHSQKGSATSAPGGEVRKGNGRRTSTTCPPDLPLPPIRVRSSPTRRRSSKSPSSPASSPSSRFRGTVHGSRFASRGDGRCRWGRWWGAERRGRIGRG